MRPHIEQVVDALLNAVATSGQMAVIADLPYPLPVTIIMELLGLPVEERADFKRWSDDVIAFSAGGGEPVRAAHSAQELTRWVTHLAEDRRGEELLDNVVLLLMNGHETTTFMIANAVLRLWRIPTNSTRCAMIPA
jgi:cytochrome P450